MVSISRQPWPIVNTIVGQVTWRSYNVALKPQVGKVMSGIHKLLLVRTQLRQLCSYFIRLSCVSLVLYNKNNSLSIKTNDHFVKQHKQTKQSAPHCKYQIDDPLAKNQLYWRKKTTKANSFKMVVSLIVWCGSERWAAGGWHRMTGGEQGGDQTNPTCWLQWALLTLTHCHTWTPQVLEGVCHCLYPTVVCIISICKRYSLSDRL